MPKLSQLSLSLALVSVLAAPPASAQDPYLRRTIRERLVGPYAIVLADFNRDGQADIAVTDFVDNSVLVYRGGGRGTFFKPVRYSVLSGPSSIAAGDLNGDGAPDLVVTCYGKVAGDRNVGVQILIGRGDGSFEAARTDANPAITPHHVMIADFNSDGRPDLAIAEDFSNPANILLNRGDGTFGAAARLDRVSRRPHAVAAGDFNRDGKNDVAVAALEDSVVNIYLGNGDGTFRKGVDLPVGRGTHHVLATDLNHDGLPDLVSVDSMSACDSETGPGSITVLLGNGDGTFRGTGQPQVGRDPLYAEAADLDGDGHQDLAVANLEFSPSGLKPNARSLTILYGKGNGTFREPVNYETLGGAYTVALGDVDRDGRPDIAITNSSAVGIPGVIRLFQSLSEPGRAMPGRTVAR